MIVVRNCFVAKPGQASKLAAQLKDAATIMGLNFRVLTDITGDFNRVVLEYEAQDIAEFQNQIKMKTIMTIVPTLNSNMVPPRRNLYFRG